MKSPKAIVLLNLGTPDEPTPRAVGRYLKEFLMDRWVLDIAFLLRWLLVHVFIVPKRKHASAEAYQKVWAPQGSPLRVYSEDLTSKVAQALGSDFFVQTAMRYGSPSIASAFQEIQKRSIQDVLVVPLYPQYAESSTRTAQEECARVVAALKYNGQIEYLSPFYRDPRFIASYTRVAQPLLQEFRPQHVLMSFHGLPERHIRRTDETRTHCLQTKNCCDQIVEANRYCYRAHCYATARALAKELKLSTEQYSVSFQSRLGRTPWIQPYTDFRYAELAQQGVKKLAVICPSFTVDCLETLEEIAQRGAADFRAAGGQTLLAVPCLNAEPFWVQSLSEMIRERA